MPAEASLTGVHLLLTYSCTFACDHCFLYSGPQAVGTMTLPEIRTVLEQARRLGGVEWIYFEGGEPFLFYPTLLEGVALARRMGFAVGIVSNGHGCVSPEDAEVWLRPLAELGVASLSISDDSLHGSDGEDGQAQRAVAAARALGIPCSAITTRSPFVEAVPDPGPGKATLRVAGDVMFKGRAVEKLTAGLPRRPWYELTRCPYEELRHPARVHVDHFGHVHVCQGLSIGNVWQRPLSAIAREYDAEAHPVCGPLLAGGPAFLARLYGVRHEEAYVDECHLCFLTRRALLDRFPEHLAPRQVYG